LVYKITEDIDRLTDLSLSVGTFSSKHKSSQRPLTPIEVAKYIKMIKDETGESDKDISKRLKLGRKRSKSGKIIEDVDDENRSDSQVKSFLRLLKISKKSVHLIGFNGDPTPVKFSTATKLHKLKPEDQDLILRQIAKHKLSRDEVIRVLEYQKKYELPYEECIDKVLNIRPDKSVQYMVAYNIPNSVNMIIQKFGDTVDVRCKKMIQNVQTKLSGVIDEITIDEYFLIIFMDETAYQSFENEMDRNNLTYNQCVKNLLIGDSNE